MTGFYDITTILKNQLILDPFVNTVTEGDIFEVDLGKQTIFPLSHIMVNQATREGHAIRFNVTIMCMDIVDKTKDETTDSFRGNDNEQDVLNTQLAVALRCVEVLDRGDLRESATLDGEVTFEPFTERFENYLAGWSATFDVLVRNTMTSCDSGASLITCPLANYIVEYADGTPIESGTIASGATKTIVVPNCPACDSANWTLLDTDGNVLDSGTIASGGSANITAPDATYSNSDNSYSGSVLSGGSLSIPDSQINVNGVDEGDVVSVKTIDVNITDGTDPVTPDSVSLVGNTLTIAVPTGGVTPVGAKPLKTGQTTSYASEDDGATQRGRLVDFFTLPTNNAFGNTNRFTDLTGGQTYASNGVFLDHSTDNGNEILAFTNSPTNTDWSTTLTSIAAQSTDGKTDWYMPNVQELNLLVNEAANPNLNWSPLNVVATPFSGNIYSWTSTTPISNTARAKAFYSSNAIDGNEMRTRAKTLGVRSLACRYYTYSELGI